MANIWEYESERKRSKKRAMSRHAQSKQGVNWLIGYYWWLTHREEPSRHRRIHITARESSCKREKKQGKIKRRKRRRSMCHLAI